MDKRTKDCYDEVMICHGVDNLIAKHLKILWQFFHGIWREEKVKDNETV